MLVALQVSNSHLATMSRPIDLTVILTKEINGVLMGIFINDRGECQYHDGRTTTQTDEK